MPSKYGNIKTEYKGYSFHSKKEAEYALLLDTQRRARDPRMRVVEWEPQVPYPIVVDGTKVAEYRADFFVKYADGHTEVIDVKGFRTAIYKLKKKLIEALYKIKIIEI